MSEFSPSQLLVVLDELLSNSPYRLCVALSGGLDSMALLHALVQLRDKNNEWSLRAVHVNHQLQKDADRWAQQCIDWCAQLDAPCKALTVQVSDIKNQGMEAAARKARYAALQAELESDEVLLTAHHADDQLETVLIALMRGAGLDGLAAMPSIARFAHAWHARPLLGFTRNELQSWAQQHGMPYITDPTNTQTQFDRNYLRLDVIPRLKQRWQSVATTGARSASHLSEAQSLLNEYVAQDYLHAAADNTLSIEVLRGWSSARRRAVIRYWLQHNEVLMPSTRVLQALEHDMFNSEEDRVPCTRWDEYAVHRHQQRLYLEKQYQPEHFDDCMQWHWHEPLRLPHRLGSLCLTAPPMSYTSLRLDAKRLPSPLMVRFRQGGEQLQLPGESFHRELKKLFNDAGVLPWWRGRVPLIYADEQLVAVADLWISANFVAVDTQAALQLQWSHDKNVVFSVK